MKWPFSKRKSAADVAIEWLPRAIGVASQKWIDFQVLQFRDDVPLEMRIMALLAPLQQELKQWQAFEHSPDDFFLIVAMKGVERSGTRRLRSKQQSVCRCQICDR